MASAFELHLQYFAMRISENRDPISAPIESESLKVAHVQAAAVHVLEALSGQLVLASRVGSQAFRKQSVSVR